MAFIGGNLGGGWIDRDARWASAADKNGLCCTIKAPRSARCVRAPLAMSSSSSSSGTASESNTTTTTANEDGMKGQVVDAQSVSAGAAGLMETVYDTVQIMKILPHRYPFLLLDKVVQYVPGESAIGIKNVSMNEPQFTGHFPDRPIMPGVLQIEAMAQLGGIVMLQEPITDGKGEFFFAAVDNVKWRKPVVPGDTLVMEMTLKAFKKRFGVGKMSGKAYVDGKLVVEGDFTFAYVDSAPNNN